MLATDTQERLYRTLSPFYTASKRTMMKPCKVPVFFINALAVCFLSAAALSQSFAQEAEQKPTAEAAGQKAEKGGKSDKAENPAQIELLETKVRFETNGDSRKEVHTLVKIHSELGVRQFAQLNFDFNRSFESVEIPMVHITHASGGTSDILPSAVTDHPNPAVVNAPAYQDVRVKSVRILGLQPGDTLEYRVIRAVSHHPLAPDFWLDHSFDRSGVVSDEHFQVILPVSILAKSPLIVVKDEKDRVELESRLGPPPGCGLCVEPNPDAEIDPSLIDSSKLLNPRPGKIETTPAKPAEIPLPTEPLPPVEYGKIQILVKGYLPAPSIEEFDEGGDRRVSYTWQQRTGSQVLKRREGDAALEAIADIEVGNASRWHRLSAQLYNMFSLPEQLPNSVLQLSKQLTLQAVTAIAKAEKIYDFVSQKIRTVELPLGATGFKPRPLEDIISYGYATQEDKFFLFQGLARAARLQADALLVGPSKKIASLMATPAAFSHLIIWVSACDCYLDPSLEVAPFRVLPATYRGSMDLLVGIDEGPIVDLPPSPMIGQIPENLPFASSQRVMVDASLDGNGKLSARVKYAMRGENELLLRVTFHQSPKERWKELAQLLSITDSFRGQVTGVTASDPYATKEPFSIEYELEQPKFVDWSKKTVRIPALLPQLGLPDVPAKPIPGSPTAPIELGTPLEVETRMTLHLPPDTAASAPAGISVERDYATYSSRYSASGSTITASRHIKFILRQVPGARAADYNAFLRAVQSDESQDFTIERAETSPSKTNSAAPNATAPPKAVPPKP